MLNFKPISERTFFRLFSKSDQSVSWKLHFARPTRTESKHNTTWHWKQMPWLYCHTHYWALSYHRHATKLDQPALQPAWAFSFCHHLSWRFVSFCFPFLSIFPEWWNQQKDSSLGCVWESQIQSRYFTLQILKKNTEQTYSI